HVGDAGEAVEEYVVAPGDAAQAAQRAPAQLARLGELRLERVDRAAGEANELGHAVVRGRVGRAALPDLAQPMAHRLDEEAQAPGVVEQVVLQVGIAPHHPDVAQHLVEHARRAAGAALVAQLLERGPAWRTEQADRDLAIGERRVVVRNLAQARGGHGRTSAVRGGNVRSYRTAASAGSVVR